MMNRIAVSPPNQAAYGYSLLPSVPTGNLSQPPQGQGPTALSHINSMNPVGAQQQPIVNTMQHKPEIQPANMSRQQWDEVQSDKQKTQAVFWKVGSKIAGFADAVLSTRDLLYGSNIEKAISETYPEGGQQPPKMKWDSGLCDCSLNLLCVACCCPGAIWRIATRDSENREGGDTCCGCCPIKQGPPRGRDPPVDIQKRYPGDGYRENYEVNCFSPNTYCDSCYFSMGCFVPDWWTLATYARSVERAKYRNNPKKLPSCCGIGCQSVCCYSCLLVKTYKEDIINKAYISEESRSVLHKQVSLGLCMYLCNMCEQCSVMETMFL